MPANRLSAIVAEKRAVTADTALRLGVIYTSDLDDLMRLSRHFPTVRVLAA